MLNTIFVNACKAGDTDEVLLTLQQSINSDEIVDFNEGLRGACEGGHISVVELVVAYGADDWDGGLEEACKRCHLDIVNMMIRYGAFDFNRGLKAACVGNNLEIVKLMFNCGGINPEDINECLYYACSTNNLDLAELMIKLGACDFNEGLERAHSCDKPLMVKLMKKYGAKFKVNKRRNLALSTLFVVAVVAVGTSVWSRFRRA